MSKEIEITPQLIAKLMLESDLTKKNFYALVGEGVKMAVEAQKKRVAEEAALKAPVISLREVMSKPSYDKLVTEMNKVLTDFLLYLNIGTEAECKLLAKSVLSYIQTAAIENAVEESRQLYKKANLNCPF